MNIIEQPTTVEHYLQARGIELPVTPSEKHDRIWKQWSSRSVCGRDIIRLWMMAKPLLNLMGDSGPRKELMGALVRQSRIYAFG